MSGPVMSRTSRIRADWASNGPSSGNPSTIASAPSSARRSAKRIGGASTPGAYSTARSRAGSYTTTVLSYRSPSSSTVTDWVPATTWALVITYPGA